MQRKPASGYDQAVQEALRRTLAWLVSLIVSSGGSDQRLGSITKITPADISPIRAPQAMFVYFPLARWPRSIA